MTTNKIDLKNRPASIVNLIGGRLCLDFINSIGARQTGPLGETVIRDEKLNDYLDLLAWARHAGALDESETRILVKEAVQHPSEVARVFRLALRLREALYPVFKGVVKGEPASEHNISVLNEELQLASAARQIKDT